MTTDRDITGIVKAWLEDGVTKLPERVREQVLDDIQASPQLRPWWSARRLRSIMSPARIAAAVAIVVVIAGLGLNLAPSSHRVGGPIPSPTSAPSAAGLSATPTPAPTPSITCVPFAGPLPSSRADPCPAVIALVQRVVSNVGLPVARMLIEPGFFCGDPWQIVGTPPPCYGRSGLDGIGMHGWVTFVGSDKVMAIMASLQGAPPCIEKVCGSAIPSIPPTWVADVAVGGPPAGWVMPSP